jgi:hypothetical protein
MGFWLMHFKMHAWTNCPCPRMNSKSAGVGIGLPPRRTPSQHEKAAIVKLFFPMFLIERFE